MNMLHFYRRKTTVSADFFLMEERGRRFGSVGHGTAPWRKTIKEGGTKQKADMVSEVRA
jgi:hypothetical protein